MVALAAAATVVGIDRYLTHRCRGAVLSQVDDGVALLAETNPVAIALGSSQARSFEAVDELLASHTGGRSRLATVAVEDGRISTSLWVLQHRLLPLIEEQDAAGHRVRDRLHHLIFITDWWDSMLAPDGRQTEHGVEPRNLPARAWTVRDFAADVLAHGYDDYNKTFVSAAFTNVFGDSILVRDRGYKLMLRQLRYGRLQMSEAEHLASIAGKRRSIEECADAVCSAQEMQALRGVCDFCCEHGLELTILLYPALPETISPLARDTTMARFANAAKAIADAKGVRFLDWTYTSPLQLEDFRDHAHLNDKGHAVLAQWALGHDLSFLEKQP